MENSTDSFKNIFDKMRMKYIKKSKSLDSHASFTFEEQKGNCEISGQSKNNV